MEDTREKIHPHLKNDGFPSLDNKVTFFFMSQPPSFMSLEVPVPPSPAPADDVRHLRHSQEKMYPERWFPSLDKVSNLMPLNELDKIPLPPSPPPAEAELQMRDAEEKKWQNFKYIVFPSLVDDNSKHPKLLPQQVPLPPSPPPAMVVLDMGHSAEKMYPDFKDTIFSDPDDEVNFMSQLFIIACEGPLPPSLTPDNTELHERYIQEKKHPDLSYMCFSDLDDEVPELLVLSHLAEIPLPPSPPPADIVLDVGHSGDKKWPALKNCKMFKMTVYEPVMRLILFFNFVFL